MKKSIFVLVALFIVAFANAQITLEHTFVGTVYIKTPNGGDLYGGIDAPYLYSFDKTQLKMFDKDTYELYKTYTYSIPTVSYPMVDIVYLTRNIFTNDGKVSFIFCFSTDGGGVSQNYCRIIDEDGNILFDFNNPYLRSYGFSLIKMGNSYKLLAREYDYQNSNPVKTYLYSLPGNGEATEIYTPSSSKYSARKIAREGQVLVETENNTYTLQGQQVQ